MEIGVILKGGSVKVCSYGYLYPCEQSKPNSGGHIGECCHLTIRCRDYKTTAMQTVELHMKPNGKSSYHAITGAQILEILKGHSE